MTVPFRIPKFRQRLETYLGVDKATPVKDVYRLLLLRVRESGLQPRSILDVGCATGDLLVYLSGFFQGAKLAGLDIEDELLGHARCRQALKEARLVSGDAVTARLDTHDLVTCFGMMGIFDSFEPLIENLLRHVNPGGYLYVQGLMNPDDIDVRVAYRDNVHERDWERGFNIFSRERIAKWCRDRGYVARFYDFLMTSELQKRLHQPHRAYTLEMADGTRRTTNGLCLLLPETLMELHVHS